MSDQCTNYHRKRKNAQAIIILLFVLLLQCGQGLRIQGSFKTGEFYTFLAKFGFQRTDVANTNGTLGFIFGNITSNLKPKSRRTHVTLAVLDRGYFLDFYGNRSLFDKTAACEKMFNRLAVAAYDAVCNDAGQQDFLRSVPCPDGKLCLDEDNPDNVVPLSQLTYRIRDKNRPRFWYLSLVSCKLNRATCKWEHVDEEFNINYDLWLVNGNPMVNNHNPFKYQYSCDIQDLFPVYLWLLGVYSILLPLQSYAYMRQRHPITRLLQIGLASEFTALVLTNTHHVLFTFNGKGLPWISTLGDIVEIFSQSLFMLLLLLMAMGWAVTRQELKCKQIIFSIWLTYSLVHCLLYIWKRTEVDVIEDIEEYQTFPGIIILLLRIVVMIVFLVSLRDTMAHEYSPERLQFFLHFGAASLVWFSYLPLAAIVALQISALWRAKFITGVVYSADTFAYIILVHLLWPNRSQQYFLLAVPEDPNDELQDLFGNELGGETPTFSGREAEMLDQRTEETELSSKAKNGNALKSTIHPQLVAVSSGNADEDQLEKDIGELLSLEDNDNL